MTIIIPMIAYLVQTLPVCSLRLIDSLCYYSTVSGMIYTIRLSVYIHWSLVQYTLMQVAIIYHSRYPQEHTVT